VTTRAVTLGSTVARAYPPPAIDDDADGFTDYRDDVAGDPECSSLDDTCEAD